MKPFSKSAFIGRQIDNLKRFASNPPIKFRGPKGAALHGRIVSTNRGRIAKLEGQLRALTAGKLSAAPLPLKKPLAVFEVQPPAATLSLASGPVVPATPAIQPKQAPSLSYADCLAGWKQSLAGMTDSQAAVKLKELGDVRMSKGEQQAISWMVADTGRRAAKERADKHVDPQTYTATLTAWTTKMRVKFCGGSRFKAAFDSLIETVRTAGKSAALSRMTADLSAN